MKKKTLRTLNEKAIWALLVFLISCFPVFLQAQPYVSGSKEIATEDTRFAVSIYETDSTVLMTVNAVGPLFTYFINFPIFYDSTRLVLCTKNLNELRAPGRYDESAVFNSQLLSNGWHGYGLLMTKGVSVISTNVSGHTAMNAIWYDFAETDLSKNYTLDLPAGQVITLWEATFKKNTKGRKLEQQDFGIGVKTGSPGVKYYLPQFGYGGYYVYYRSYPGSQINKDLAPQLFMFRSGSSAKTLSATNVLTTSATLNGSFLAGALHLPPSNNVLDTTGSDRTGTGRLRQDSVKQFGFFYTLASANINITTSNFADSLTIGNVNYAFPSATEIANKQFERAGYTFYIAINNNTSETNTLSYNQDLIGLLPNQKYYAWSFIHYLFETSNIYKAVGNRIDFTTSDCVPLNIASAYTVEEPSCMGSDGKIQMYVTGGSGFYAFSVNGGAFKRYPNDLITDLESGTFTISVKDTIQPSCDSTSIFGVVLHSKNSDMVVSLTATDASKCDEKDGVLNVSVSGGVFPYHYKLNNSDWELLNFNEITDQYPGTYVLSVSDGAGCVASSAEVRINGRNSTLALTFSDQENTECKKAEGAITFNVNTKSTSFTYQVDGYLAVESDETAIELTDLTAGVHTLRITDDCDQIDTTFIISNGTGALAFTASVVNEIFSCTDNSVKGSITLTVTDGEAPYAYRYDNSGWHTFSTNMVIIKNLDYGTYYVEVKDNKDCEYAIQGITISRETAEPVSVNTILATVDPDCNDNNGKIQIYATGGSGSYLYKVNNATTFQSYPGGLITGLAAGTHTVTVIDSVYNTCDTVTMSNIVLNNKNTDMLVTVTAQDAEDCSTNPTGALKLNISGGIAPYQYSLDHGSSWHAVTGDIPVATGIYVVNIKDATTCVATSSEVLVNAATSTLEVTLKEDENTVCGSSTGYIKLYVTGTSNYTYQLDGFEAVTTGLSDVVLSGLSAGVHTLIISDLCKRIDTTFIIKNGANELAFTATPKNEIIACNETIGGQIILNVTPQGNYKYRYAGPQDWIYFPAGATKDTIKGLPYGTYSVEVRNVESECAYEIKGITISREIADPMGVTGIFAANDPDCNKNNGTIQVTATGGSGVYLFGVNNETPKFYQDGLITGLTAGTYNITVKDSIFTTCDDVTIHNVVLYNKSTDLMVTVAASNATNCTASDGILHLSVSGGSSPYEYLLNDETTWKPLVSDVTGLKAGIYIVTVKDADGCITTGGEVTINSKAHNLFVTFSAEQPVICGTSAGAITFSVNDATAFTYQLDGYAAETATASPVTLGNLSAGTHTLRIDAGCSMMDTTFTISNGTGGLAATATAKNEIITCGNTSLKGSITLTVTSGTPNYKYRYDGVNQWLAFPTATPTEVTIPNLSYGTYHVEFMDENSCTYQITGITISREVSEHIQVGTIFATTEPDCGQSNGVIQVYATGGSGSYLYKVNNDTQYRSYPGGLITGLAAGTHFVAVKDSVYHSCDTVTIHDIVLNSKSSDIVVTVTATDADHCGAEGMIHVTVTGGIAPYQYALNNGTWANLTGDINALVGVYEIDIRDVNKCVAAGGEVRVNAKTSGLAVTFKDNKDAVCGSSAGAITFNVTGSTSYTYQLDGFEAVTTTAPEVVLSGLNAGVHTLIITDACKQIDTIFPISNGVNALAFTVVTADQLVACEGTTLNGQIILNVTPQGNKYKYRYQGANDWHYFPAGASTDTIKGLSYGTYNVEVRNVETNCAYEIKGISILRKIAEPLHVGAIYAQTDPTCGENDGTIKVMANGGSGSYLYKVNDKPFASYSGGLIGGLGAGTYTITVIDSVFNLCDTVTIRNVILNNANSDLVIKVTPKHATDCFIPDGALNIAVTGGSGKYTYQLNGIDVVVTDGKIENKPAGTYVVNVIDTETKCLATSGEVYINSKADNLFVTFTNKVNAICGVSAGAITFTANNATSMTYQLDGYAAVTVTGNSAVLGGLNAGVHSLHVFAGCSHIDTTFIIGYESGYMVETKVQNEILPCNRILAPGYIILKATAGQTDYQYRIAGGAWKSFKSGASIDTIPNLSQGTYYIEVKDANDCMYGLAGVIIGRDVDYGKEVLPPTATSPQTFCKGATVSNLQTIESNVKWYLTIDSEIALLPTAALISDTIYYAAQTLGACEASVRTAVKVFIDNDLDLDSLVIVSPQQFCGISGSQTIAQIATDGNTNINWFNQAGTLLTPNTPIEHDVTYYAALSAGNCALSPKTPVKILYGTEAPEQLVLNTPQAFCDGATIANIAVPHNQIVWYATATGGTPLSATYRLQENVTYYAAHKAGTCESATRTGVKIVFEAAKAPELPAVQGICGNATIADLTVTGFGIVWYATKDGNTPMLLTDSIKVGQTYWAAQSSLLCEGLRTSVRITDSCYTVYGTVFPFVDNNENKFTIHAKLFEVPPMGSYPIETILASQPLYTTTVTKHDGKLYLETTPKDPGTMGVAFNPGLPINWSEIKPQLIAPTGDYEKLAKGENPNKRIGFYTFKNVKDGDYVLEISRDGYLVRWGLVTINKHKMTLGHREILSGNVTLGDFMIRNDDNQELQINYADDTEPRYKWKYDLNGDGIINAVDRAILLFNLDAFISIYKETYDWAIEYDK